jgi:hypothetical protein
MGEPVQQDAEKARQLRSRLIEILNGDPAASPTRRRAQTWCSLFVAPCAPEGTPPVSTRLRPCLGQGASRRARVGWVRSLAFLSILRDVILLLQTCRSVKFWSATIVLP